MSPDDAAPGVVELPPATQGDTLSAALYRRIADHAPSIMLVAAEADFRIVYANLAAHRAAKCAVGDLTGRPAADVFAFIDPALLACETRTQVYAVADPNRDPTMFWDVSYDPLDIAADHPPVGAGDSGGRNTP